MRHDDLVTGLQGRLPMAHTSGAAGSDQYSTAAITRVISAGHHDSEYLADLWRYRELFYFLAWRDVLVRYKQTVIGVAWILIRSIATLIVLTVTFGKVAHLPSDGVPYALLVYAAMLPWQFFASALGDCSNSLVANHELISKIYFPRLIIPGGAMMVSVLDFAVACVVLVALLIWYGFVPDWRILTLPVLTVFVVCTVLGPSLWFAALTVKYRDFPWIVGFILQLGLFVSPVGFSSTAIPAAWLWVYRLNPMVGVIDGFRWAILRGGNLNPLPSLGISGAITALMLLLGLRYFRRTERLFADVI
jgi:lipopolysaccharide transport system permease protein